MENLAQTPDQPKPNLQERLEQIEKDIRDIQTGTHIGYKNARELIEIEYEDAIERAELFKEYQMWWAKRVHFLETNHADQELSADLENLWDEMMDQLDQRKRKLKEEYEQYDITTTGNVSTRKTARLQQRQEERRQRGKKPVTASLDFQLKENEIYEDMWILRKNTPNLSQYARKSSMKRK